MNNLMNEILEMDTLEKPSHKLSCNCNKCLPKKKFRHSSTCRCPKCKISYKNTVLRKNTLLDELLFEIKLNNSQLDSAVSYNNKYARSIGWEPHQDKIRKLLGLTWVHNDWAFAEAVAGWQEKNGSTGKNIDGKLGRGTWGKMKPIIFKVKNPRITNNQNGIEDFTKKAKPDACAKQRGHRCRHKRKRSLSQIDSIVLHQTAGSPSNNPNRFLKIPIHYVILADGRIIQLYEDAVYINHANSLNRRSIGIEFAGSFMNDRAKCWMNKRYVNEGFKSGSRICGEPTRAQLMAGRRLVKTISNNIPSIKYIFAHRQSKGNRTNDPGPTVWLQVAQWANKKIGLKVDNKPVGSGKPIPNSWTRGKIIP